MNRLSLVSARCRDPGRRREPWARAVDVRLGRQPGRRVRQRPAAVLARRRPDRGGAAVPGVNRQSRKFARLARVLARTKPVIAVKSGRHATLTPAPGRTRPVHPAISPWQPVALIGNSSAPGGPVAARCQGEFLGDNPGRLDGNGAVGEYQARPAGVRPASRTTTAGGAAVPSPVPHSSVRFAARNPEPLGTLLLKSSPPFRPRQRKQPWSRWGCLTPGLPDGADQCQDTSWTGSPRSAAFRAKAPSKVHTAVPSRRARQTYVESVACRRRNRPVIAATS